MTTCSPRRQHLRSALRIACAIGAIVSVRSASAFLAQPRSRFTLSTGQLYSKLGLSATKGSSGGFGARKSADSSKVRTVAKNAPGAGTKPLRTAANSFDKLYKQHEQSCVNDLYVRSPSNDATTFWFVGKIARQVDQSQCDGSTVPTVQEAVLSHKRLILEYSQALRPQNLGGPFGKELEVWIAPGNSEMDVVQNKVALTKVTGSTADISDTFSVADVGFNPEIYVGEEVAKGGLRVKRDEDGRPIKPVFEINQ